MRRLGLLLILAAVALAAVLPSVAHGTHNDHRASYHFIIEGDNGGETSGQPAIRIKGTASVAEDGTATAQVTMLVSKDGARTTYRSCLPPVCGGFAVAEVNADNSVTVTVTMFALGRPGSRPASPPVIFSFEASLDTRDTHPDFLWQPTSLTIDKAEIDGAILVVAAAEGPMP
jgi:hypothetical protein